MAKRPSYHVGVIERFDAAIAAAAAALNRRSATGARERVEIEVPAPKLDLTNVDAFHQMYSVRVPTSIKSVGRTVRTWSVRE
jgi:hypothetical protein